MPTSNQTTDTNNNSGNRKISTRQSTEIPVVGVGVVVGGGGGGGGGGGIGGGGGDGGGGGGGALINENINSSSTINDNNNIMLINHQTPPIIKHSEQLNNSSQQLINNNNNNKSIRNSNSITIYNNNNINSLNNNNNNNSLLHQNNHTTTNNHNSNNNYTNSNNNNNNNSNNNNNINHHHQQQQYQNHERQPQQQHQATTNCRSIEELTLLIKDINFDRTSLTNEELIKLVKRQLISVYKLESFLGKDNAARCVEVRRDYYRLELAELDKLDLIKNNEIYNNNDDECLLSLKRAEAFNHPRYEDLEYEKVNGACCENVIGHVKVPVGIAGPLVLDGEEIFVPLATTEGCLVASTCRGLSALRKSGGVSSRVRKDFMTRAPIIRFHDTNLSDALDNVERAINWLNDKQNMEKMRLAFNLTSSHGKFLNYTLYPISREIHIRFEAQTGDAMGMNMCSKGVESALKKMQSAFPTMEIVTLSGNMCTDKKAAGINWINGRGKSVECNAELPAQVVQQVFKVSVDSMIDRWKSKVMVGSALAASIGGFNSQAANILTAIFIATGQDPAQNVTSSNCMLILEKDSKGSLVVCCTMPSIECGTVGGGTILGDQSRYLQMMGVKGPTPKQYQLNNNQLTKPINLTNGYTNARKLARIICATVMAGELSLLAALTEGTLVKSHMRHNRSSTNVTTTTTTTTINNTLLLSSSSSSSAATTTTLPTSSTITQQQQQLEEYQQDEQQTTIIQTIF